MSGTQIAIHDENISSFGIVRRGLAGNYDIVVRMVELTRNASFFDKGFEQFTKKLIASSGLSSYTSVKSLFDFIYSYVNKNITYIRDAAGNVEQLKTARQTLSDGYGDCDDQSILVASILAVLGYEPVFVLARYDQTAETYSHIYVACYIENERYVFDTTIPNGHLGMEVSAVATKEIAVFDYLPELDGASGFFKQTSRLMQDLFKAGIQATPNAIGFLPFGLGYVASHALSAGAGLMSNTFSGALSYAELATAINRQLDAILVRLYKSEISLDEAKSYARLQYGRFAAENLDTRASAKTLSKEEKEAIDKGVQAKLDAVLNFDVIGDALGIETFNLDTNKMLIAGLAVAGIGVVYLLKRG